MVINIRHSLWLSLFVAKCLAGVSEIALVQKMEEKIDYGDNFRKVQIDGSQDGFELSKDLQTGELERRLVFGSSDALQSLVSPPTSSPTDSQAPSGDPSSSPTETPTESPAPSPSPSESPTDAPTGTQAPNDAPTSEPTDSPAPSPSPSDAPTSFPSTSPSANPTPGPTLTNGPTTSPSDQPSDVPSTLPSDLPSISPSMSQVPSDHPTNGPTQIPSDEPSNGPTASPTTSLEPSSGPTAAPSSLPTSKPSDIPTGVPSSRPSTSAPSDSPTGIPTLLHSDAPSLVPSDRPSPVPTSELVTFESVHAKTATITVLLDGIVEEMADFPLAKFEIQTLEFVQATMQDTEGFKMQVLAVTVLTQTIVDSDSKVEGNGGRRILADGEKSLKVSFRVVGVIKTGVAPDDVNYSDLFGYGFQNHYTEYLQRISSVDPFFDDLLVGRSADQLSLVKDKKKFIATIACSAMAFLVAVFASYYAIKKHLSKRLQEKNLLVIAPSTQSSSSSLGHPKLGEANSLQLEIVEPAQVDPSSPMMAALKACMEGDETMSRLQESPMSPNTLEKGSGRRKSKSPFNGGGIEVRKWLTPRRESGGRNVFTSEVEPLNSARGGQDPPERSRTSDIPTFNAVSPVDPDARKASTTDAPNRLSNVSNHNDTSTETKTKLSLQSLSSHNRKPPSGSQHKRTVPFKASQGSIVGSAANSFFMKMGNAFGKKTPKSEAAYSDAPKSFAGASEPNSFSRNESKAGRVPMSEADINEGPSETRRETSKAYKVSYTERRTRHSKKSDKFSESRSSEGSRASVGNLLDQHEEDVEPAPSEIGLNAYTEELGSRKGRGSHSDLEYGGRRSTHTMNSEQADHMYVEQMSEIRLTESIGGTLGARVEYVQTENYIPEPYAFPSRSQSSNIQYHDTRPGRSPEEESPRWNDRKNIKPLGARPLGEIEPPTSTAQNNTREIKRTSSSEAGYNAKLRAGSYDVFAPSGPIGIVVDTSKEGPAVHSLKSTSPMLGLINPGDLIVALDDEDTREMTAATLTRLMAKRSRQNERKITLIAMDNY